MTIPKKFKIIKDDRGLWLIDRATGVLFALNRIYHGRGYYHECYQALSCSPLLLKLRGVF